MRELESKGHVQRPSSYRDAGQRESTQRRSTKSQVAERHITGESRFESGPQFNSLLIALIVLVSATAHAQERQCPPDDTLCVAEVAAARLSAANAKIASLTQINTDQKAIIDAKDQLIGVKDQIIANLQKLDTNSQRIDTLGRDSKLIYEAQHRDDKTTIGQLQDKLDSCRNNQKWIFAGGALTGGAIAWKIKSNNGTLVNPFTTSGIQTYQMTFQTSADQKAKQAMRMVTK